jgi:hypothetical protein
VNELQVVARESYTAAFLDGMDFAIDVFVDAALRGDDPGAALRDAQKNVKYEQRLLKIAGGRDDA